MHKIKPQNRFIKQNEVLLNVNGEWLYFSAPYQIIVADHLADVLPALQELEKMSSIHEWYAAGFLSYEAASAFDATLKTKPESGFPCLWFGLYPKPSVVTLPRPEAANVVLDWRATIDQDGYDATIAKIKHYIAEGNTYQVNYTMRLKSDFIGNTWDFFLHLVQQQNRHAAYIDTGRYVIASASPELFFQLDGNTITSQPMKGTLKRGRTTIEDQEQSILLKESEKNRAENVMIVDMIRNDLGKIAQVGSVSVPGLFETERYPTLWQMTSTITAQTKASLTEIFAALFPSASITGAPKVSTMRIIADLENTPRKIYTGTIGYLSPGRTASFNVAIRTLLIDHEQQSAEYGIGSGIVWDSSSKEEYAEALLKAQVLMQRPQLFSLLETMLWTPDHGFFLREKHVTRMLDSAAYFDIPITKQKLEEYLEQSSVEFCAPQRVRVLLNQAGELRHQSNFFDMTDKQFPVKVRLAREAVDSRSVFLFHKTTQREVYESARRAVPEAEDILLYNERGELTELTIGNLVVERNNQWLTPPISCGVLAGTFRAYLLETGQVLERTITLDQIKECNKLFRVNSIRKWEQVEIQE